jgi:hypothetical protein
MMWAQDSERHQQTKEKHMSNSITVTVELPRSADGSVDRTALDAALSAGATRQLADLETEETQIAQALNSVFDENKGVAIKMPALAHAACTKLNTPHEYFTVISARVLDFVRANSQGEKAEDGSVERPDSLFVTARGAKGGVSRRSDLPAPAAQ